SRAQDERARRGPAMIVVRAPPATIRGRNAHPQGTLQKACRIKWPMFTGTWGRMARPYGRGKARNTGAWTLVTKRRSRAQAGDVREARGRIPASSPPFRRSPMGGNSSRLGDDDDEPGRRIRRA